MSYKICFVGDVTSISSTYVFFFCYVVLTTHNSICKQYYLSFSWQSWINIFYSIECIINKNYFRDLLLSFRESIPKDCDSQEAQIVIWCLFLMAKEYNFEIFVLLLGLCISSIKIPTNYMVELQSISSFFFTTLSYFIKEIVFIGTFIDLYSDFIWQNIYIYFIFLCSPPTNMSQLCANQLVLCSWNVSWPVGASYIFLSVT